MCVLSQCAVHRFIVSFSESTRQERRKSYGPLFCRHASFPGSRLSPACIVNAGAGTALAGWPNFAFKFYAQTAEIELKAHCEEIFELPEKPLFVLFRNPFNALVRTNFPGMMPFYSEKNIASLLLFPAMTIILHFKRRFKRWM